MCGGTKAAARRARWAAGGGRMPPLAGWPEGGLPCH